jgi:putative acetyltransferase
VSVTLRGQLGCFVRLRRTLLLILRELRFEHIIVLGHSRFYPKFGFKPVSLFGIAPSFPVPDEVFMALELTENTLQNINGKVAYPPSFDSVT